MDGQSGRSTPSQGGATPSLERGSKIPRPEGELLGTIRKWDSTSCLEVTNDSSTQLQNKIANLFRP